MNRAAKAILYGLAFIFAIIFIVGFILSLFLRFSNVTEQSLQWTTLVITFIALFIGGFIAGGKSKESGWMLGGITGLCFVIIVFLIQYLGFNASIELTQLLYHFAYVVTAAFGGIIGVNVSNKST
mgnify:FL=1